MVVFVYPVPSRYALMSRDQQPQVLLSPPSEHSGLAISYLLSRSFADRFGWETQVVQPKKINLVAGTVAAHVPILTHLFLRTRPVHARFAVSNGARGLLHQAPLWLSARGPRSAYIMDVWPSRFNWVIRLARLYKLDPVFISYKAAAERLQALAPDINWVWMAEGMLEAPYAPRPPNERTTDLLAFGRKLIPYHNALKEREQEMGLKYLYTDSGNPLFEDHDELVAALCNSKITFCVPRSVTHPEVEGLEAVTFRYFLAMGCKCLIVGHCPPDLEELFGYNPIIEADLNDPVGQIQSLLANYETHLPLVERNHATTISAHTWGHRLDAMAHILKESYGFPIQK